MSGDEELELAIQGLSLYYFASCPFCVRVRVALQKWGIELELRDIHQERARADELFEATGRTSVPCLRIEAHAEGADEEQWMFESMDIIRFLGERFS